MMAVKQTNHVALSMLAGAVAVLTVSLSGASPERLVTSAFEQALAQAPQSSTSRQASAPVSSAPSYDGRAGSEAFWLDLANPNIAKTAAVGQPLTLRAAAVAGPHDSAQPPEERRLIVVAVREIDGPSGSVRRLPVDETRIDLSADGSAKRFMIVARDTSDPAAAEFLILWQNGTLTLLTPLGTRTL